MHNSRPPLALMLLAVLLAFSINTQAAVIGSATAIQGQVFLNPDSSNTALRQGDKVNTADVVATGSDGSATITLTDGSTLSIDAGSRLVLSEYDLGAKPSGLFDLTRGRLRAVVTDAFSREKNSFRVRTGTAVMGVQGTDFITYTDAILTIVQVIAGIVQVVNIDPNVAGAILLQPGDGAEIRAGEGPDLLSWPSGGPGTGPYGSGGSLDNRSGGTQGTDPGLLTPALDGGGVIGVPPTPNVPEP